MSGYRRFIAYVYEYQKGKKGSNCGFIKVEVREQRCTMEVHLHCVGLTPQVECSVYGFVRKDGLMDGILLGRCETGEDTAECLIEADSLNMGGAGISLGKMCGMVLVTESGGFFGTEWDDQPIRPDNFRVLQRTEHEMKQETQSGKEKRELPDTEGETRQDLNSGEESDILESESSTLQDNGMLDRSNEDNSIKIIEKTRIESNQDVSSESGILSEGENVEGLDAKSNMEAEETGEKPTNGIRGELDTLVNENMEMKKTEGHDMNVVGEFFEGQESSEDYKVLEETIEEFQGGGDAQELKAGMEEAAVNDPSLNMAPNVKIIGQPNSNCGPGPRPPMPGPRPPMPGPRPPMPGPGFRPPMSPRRMAKTSIGEEFMPFGDGEVTQCWKIHPKDFAYFQHRECALRNNRFLLHGYYNFGHLLLGQKANGQYILGVPGGYDQQERFMANMFGFPYFKESNQIELPKGRGGYWYRLINAPNFH